MRLFKFILFAMAIGSVAEGSSADTLIAEHTIPAQNVLTPQDIRVVNDDGAGVAVNPASVVGLEARKTIYKGRPILPEDLGPPALIDRNQIVLLTYRSGALVIMAEGRALGRGGFGDRIRVMNVASRTNVNGIVNSDGSVRVLTER